MGLTQQRCSYPVRPAIEKQCNTGIRLYLVRYRLRDYPEVVRSLVRCSRHLSETIEAIETEMDGSFNPPQLDCRRTQV